MSSKIKKIGVVLSIPLICIILGIYTTFIYYLGHYLGIFLRYLYFRTVGF